MLRIASRSPTWSRLSLLWIGSSSLVLCASWAISASMSVASPATCTTDASTMTPFTVPHVIRLRTSSLITSFWWRFEWKFGLNIHFNRNIRYVNELEVVVLLLMKYGRTWRLNLWSLFHTKHLTALSVERPRMFPFGYNQFRLDCNRSIADYRHRKIREHWSFFCGTFSLSVAHL